MSRSSLIRTSFTNSAGEKLSANLELPNDKNPKAYCIFAHCFTCGKSIKSVKNISDALTSNGYAVLNFDFTGLGNSEGDFSDSNFSSNIDDVVAASVFLTESYEGPQVLIGHSLGGAAVLSAASKIDSVKAVVTIGAPYDPAHVQKLLKNDISAIEENGEAEVDLGGRNFKIKKQFLEDLEEANNASCIENLNSALLVMHSPQDVTVEIENARLIYDEAKHPKSFISLDGADHLLLEENHAEYAGNVISTWITKYIQVSNQYELTTNKHVVVRTGREKYTTNINAGGHYILADEPKNLGGKDRGASPYAYLLAALGACTSITLRMYADRKGWDVESITVHLDHDKVHLEDCKDCRKMDKLTRSIELEGNLDEDQRTRLLSIADRCPVHRTLSSEMLIKTELMEG